MNSRHIARALDGRKSGNGYIARCPAHADRSPSLSIRDADGRVLVHCFGGCTQDDVIEALRQRGVWPAAKQHTPAQRREYGQRQRAIQRLILEASHFARAARALTAMAIETADHPERIGLVDMVRDLRGSPITTYTAWRERHPGLTAALVRAGRASDTRLQRRLAAYIAAEGQRAA